MDNDRAQVDEDPSGLHRPLDVMGLDAFLLQRPSDLLAYSLDLSPALTAADDEVVGERAYLRNIEKYDLGCLLLLRRLNRFSSYLQ